MADGPTMEEVANAFLIYRGLPGPSFIRAIHQTQAGVFLAVYEDYVLTGKPVEAGALMAKTGMDLESLQSIMRALCAEGYLDPVVMGGLEYVALNEGFRECIAYSAAQRAGVDAIRESPRKGPNLTLVKNSD